MGRSLPGDHDQRSRRLSRAVSEVDPRDRRPGKGDSQLHLQSPTAATENTDGKLLARVFANLPVRLLRTSASTPPEAAATFTRLIVLRSKRARTILRMISRRQLRRRCAEHPRRVARLTDPSSPARTRTAKSIALALNERAGSRPVQRRVRPARGLGIIRQ